MTAEGRAESGSMVIRVVRVVVPWFVLGFVVILAWGYLGQYREARSGSGTEGQSGSQSGTGTVEPTGSVDASASPGADIAKPYVRVLAEGLNLRSRPMTSATVVKQLPAGQQLTLIEKGSGWYHVRDAAGDEGWVAAGGRYTELVE
jgi:hypothetical protein